MQPALSETTSIDWGADTLNELQRAASLMLLWVQWVHAGQSQNIGTVA